MCIFIMFITYNMNIERPIGRETERERDTATFKTYIHNKKYTQSLKMQIKFRSNCTIQPTNTWKKSLQNLLKEKPN